MERSFSDLLETMDGGDIEFFGQKLYDAYQSQALSNGSPPTFQPEPALSEEGQGGVEPGLEEGVGLEEGEWEIEERQEVVIVRETVEVARRV